MSQKKTKTQLSDSKLFYISPYLPKDEKYEHHYSPAAQSKVDYLRSALAKHNTITVCINCSLNVDNSFYLPKRIKDDKGQCHLLLSKSSTTRWLMPLCGAIMLCSVFCYVLFNIGSKDTVILYHSIYYDDIITFLKRIKKFKLIYEIEEIYADVRNNGMGRDKEISRCQSSADAYIFPTEMLDEIINTDQKSSVIVYGAYNPCVNKGEENNNKVRVVYSGTLMQGKGAMQAVDCAKSLDDNFEIRVIGYGSESEIKLIMDRIANNDSSCKVYFDGMKNGDDYIQYLSKCDIGLCIQPTENCFNGTSFPSKILNYFNCGLNVVATNMEALRRSQLSDYIFFANDYSPEEVAKAIRKACSKKINTVSLLKTLNKRTVSDIDNLINNL